MIYHYVEMKQDGMLSRIGIGTDGGETAFVVSEHMAFKGLEYRMKAFQNLVALADTLRKGGAVVEGYDDLVKGAEKATNSYHSYERHTNEQ